MEYEASILQLTFSEDLYYVSAQKKYNCCHVSSLQIGQCSKGGKTDMPVQVEPFSEETGPTTAIPCLVSEVF